MESWNSTRSALVVGDDPLSRNTIGQHLVKAGFVITLAVSGEEAMNCLALATFQVVITDVRMSGMSGIDLLRDIRRRFPWQPVVLITARIQEDIRDAALTWGASAVLQKPLSCTSLISAIHSAIKDSSLRAGLVAAAEACSS